jgi:hypothetical protein
VNRHSTRAAGGTGRPPDALGHDLRSIGEPIFSTSRPDTVLSTPANEVYQATSAVSTPT